MKHTPGPWEDLSKGYPKQIELSKRWKCNIGKRISDLRGRMIATIFGDTKDEARANTNLISAAPDLLEALQFCKSVIKSQGMFDLSERMAFDKANAAIEKATGEKEATHG